MPGLQTPIAATRPLAAMLFAAGIACGDVPPAAPAPDAGSAVAYPDSYDPDGAPAPPDGGVPRLPADVAVPADIRLCPEDQWSDGAGTDSVEDGLTEPDGLCTGEPADVIADDAGPVDVAEPADPGDGEEAVALPGGTWASPFVVGPLPWSHAHDTTGAASEAGAYTPCAPGTDESGPEVVYVLTLEEPGKLTVAVDDEPGDAIDVDVHLLSEPDPDACLARNNVAFTIAVTAGTYWIVADTWVDSAGTPKPGPYVLSISLSTGTAPGPCTGGGFDCTDAGPPPLVNGVPVEPPGASGCPPGMIAVEAFCIDRYEAALVAVGSAGELGPFSPYAHPGKALVRAVSAPGLVPQGYVTQIQAQAACLQAGKRLCTDVEWLRACQGPSKTTYPYGGTLKPKVCNDSRPCHPVVEYFGTSAGWIWSELGHPCINQLPESLAKTGDHPGCVSAEGAYDMMGNLHEWTADPAGTFRGGFYVDTKINGPGCLYATTAHNVYHWDYSTGFRCCADL